METKLTVDTSKPLYPIDRRIRPVFDLPNLYFEKPPRSKKLRKRLKKIPRFIKNIESIKRSLSLDDIKKYIKLDRRPDTGIKKLKRKSRKLKSKSKHKSRKLKRKSHKSKRKSRKLKHKNRDGVAHYDDMHGKLANVLALAYPEYNETISLALREDATRNDIDDMLSLLYTMDNQTILASQIVYNRWTGQFPIDQGIITIDYLRDFLSNILD